MLIPLSSTECAQSLIRLKSWARKLNHNNICAELRCQKLKFESKTTPKPETRIPLGRDTTTQRVLTAAVASYRHKSCSFLAWHLEEPLPPLPPQRLLYRKQSSKTPKDMGMSSFFALNMHCRWAMPAYRLLSFQLKTTAKHWEPPEGLDFIRAACGASSHSYGIRLKYPPSSEWF